MVNAVVPDPGANPFKPYSTSHWVAAPCSVQDNPVLPIAGNETPNAIGNGHVGIASQTMSSK